MNASVRKYVNALQQAGISQDQINFFFRGVDLEARNMSVGQLRQRLDVLGPANLGQVEKIYQGNQAAVTPTDLSALQAMVNQLTGNTAAPPPPDPVQQALDSGDVKALQTALGFTGKDVDGIRGRKTNAALAAYQGGHPNITVPAAPTAMRAQTSGGGGGGGRTVTVAPATPPGPAKPQSDQEIRDYVAQSYGYAASYLNDPEIGPILLRAAREGWDQGKLQGALFATNWWKSTTDNQRAWDKQKALDPATAQQQVTDQATMLSTQAKSMGITIAPDRLNQIANDSLRNKWSAAQTQQALGHEFVYKPPTQGTSQQTGGALTTEQTIKQIAGDYLVPLSDTTLAQWEGQILSGDITVDQFKGYAQEQAKSLFPGLAKAIDSGVTVKQYIEPYAQIASTELEKPAETFNFTDPKYIRAVSSIDPKTGDRTAMNLSDWTTYLRSLPEWRTTNRANDMASGLTQQLLTTFGATT